MGSEPVVAALDATVVVILFSLVAAAMAGVAARYGLALSRDGYSRHAKSMLVASLIICITALAFVWLLLETINGSGY